MRAILNIILFFSIITGPWWIPLLAALALATRWHAWEVLVAGALFDVLYASQGGFWGIPVTGTLVGAFFVFVLMPLRERLMAE
jgi:hypothetical protein